MEALQRCWSGVEPTQTAPVVTEIYINNTKRTNGSSANNIYVNSGATFTGKVDATDKEGNTMTYVWEILKEGASTRPGIVQNTGVNTANFSVSEKGNYRLYVYVLDGTGYVGTANIPFQIQ